MMRKDGPSAVATTAALLLLLCCLLCGRAVEAVQNFNLAPTLYFTAQGLSANSRFGHMVDWIDMDGDSDWDIMVCSPQDDTEGTNTGRVFFMKPTGSSFPAPTSGSGYTSTTSTEYTADSWKFANGVQNFGRSAFFVTLNGDSFPDALTFGSTGQMASLLGSSSGLPTGLNTVTNVVLQTPSTVSGSTPVLRNVQYWEMFASSAVAGDFGRGLYDTMVGAPYGCRTRSGGGSLSNCRGFVAQYRQTTAGVIQTSATTTRLAWDSAWWQEYEFFGQTLVKARLMNNDAIDDLFVCAPSNQQTGNNWQFTQVGSCVVFQGSTLGLGTSPTYTVTPNVYGEAFGVSAAFMKVSTSDTQGLMVVGAPFSTLGAVYVYKVVSGALSTSFAQRISGVTPFGEFGYMVADGGDLNNDGFNDLVVGAPFAGATYNGAIYGFFYSSSTTLFATTPSWTLVGPTPYSGFGRTFAGRGADVNSDGFDDLVIGAHMYGTGAFGTGNGAVFVYTSPKLVDLGVSASFSTTTPVASTSPVLTVIVTNAGPSTGSALKVFVTMPTTVSMTASTYTAGSCSSVSGLITCTRGSSFSVGGSDTITLTINVPGSVIGSLAFGVSVEVTEVDVAAANNNVALTITSSAVANIAFDTPAATPTVWNLGASGNTFTAVVRNAAGPSTAFTTTAVVTYPSATVTLTNAQASQGSCSIVAGTVTCAIGDLAFGATSTITLTATLSATAGASVAFSGTVTTASSDTVNGNDAVSLTVNTQARPNLGVSCVVTPQPPVAGAILGVAITVVNAGPSTATSIVLTNTPGAGLTYSSHLQNGLTCTLGANNVVTCTLASMAAGAPSVSAVIAYTVAPSYLSSELSTNTATISSAQTDLDASDNTCSFSSATTAASDVSVGLASNPATIATLGTQVSYSATISSAGPSNSKALTVTCPLNPTAGVYTYVTGSLAVVDSTTYTPDPASSCVYTAPNAICTLPNVGAGQKSTVSFAMLVGAGAVIGQTHTITCTATAGVGTPSDPVAGNNAASLMVTFDNTADLTLSFLRTPSTATLSAGDVYTLSLSSFNSGPSSASAVTIVATLPAGHSILSPPSGCVVAGLVVTCSGGTINALAAYSTTLTVQIPSSAAAAAVSVAISTSTTAVDPNAANNAVSAGYSIVKTAALRVVLARSTSTVTAGQTIIWTGTVTNNGPSDTSAISTVFTLGYCENVAVPSGCVLTSQDVSSATVTCTTASLVKGASVPYAITTTMMFSGEGLATTQSVTTSTSASTDPSLTDNTASLTTNVATSSCDMSTSAISFPATNVVAGADLTYTIAVSNAGPQAAGSVVTTINLPPSSSFESASASLGSCSHTSGVVTCSLGTVLTGSPRTLTVTVATSNTFVGTLAMSASTSTVTVDNNPGNNGASVNVASAISIDMAVTFSTVGSVVPSQFTAGGTVTVTMVAINNGPSLATGASATFTVPAFMTGLSTSTPGCVVGGFSVTCTFASSLASGVSQSSTIVFTIPADTAASTAFTLSASTTAAQSDSNAGNNVLNVDGTVTILADASVGITATPLSVPLNQPVNYVVTVSNLGPSQDTSVSLSCVLPDPATSYFSLSLASLMGGCTYTAGTRTVSCSPGQVNVGSPEQFTFQMTQASPNGWAGTAAVSCSITTTQPDPIVANNAASVTVTVNPQSNILLTGSYFPAGNAVAGTSALVAFTSVNLGPSIARSLTQVLTAPPGVTILTVPAACSTAGSVVTCINGDLVAYAAVASSVVFSIDAASVATSVTFTVSATVVSDASPNSISIVVPVVRSADLGVSVSVAQDPISVGAVQTYSASIFNTGPSTATSVVFSTTLADVFGVSVVSPSSGCTVVPAGATSVVTCTFASMAPNAATNVVIAANTDFDTAGTNIAFAAEVSSAVADPSSPSTDSVSYFVRLASSDLSTTATFTPDPAVTAGSAFSLIMYANNNGPDDNSAVLLDGSWTASSLDITSVSSSANMAVTYVPGSSTVSATGAVLPFGQSGFVQIVGTVASTYAGPIAFSTTVSGSISNDPVGANNAFSDSVTSSTSVDMVALMAITPAAPVAGSTVTVSAEALNNGPSLATSVTAVFTVPAAVLSPLSTPPGCSSTGAGVLTCTVAGSVAAGSSAPFTITYTVTDGLSTGTDADVTLVVAAAQSDPLPGSNSKTVEAATVVRTDLYTFLSVVPVINAPIGQGLSFVATFENDGPSSSSGASVVCSLPSPAVSFVTSAASVTSGTGSCSAPSGGSVACTLTGSIAPGATRTISWTTAVAQDVSLVGTASATCTVTANENDPVSGNNAASASVAVNAAADLRTTTSIIGTVSGGTTLYAGKAFSVSTVVRNFGPSLAVNPTISLALPTGVSTFGALPAGCSLGGSTITCSFGNLNVFVGSLAVTLNLITDPLIREYATSISIVVTADADNTLVNPALATTTNVLAMQYSADLYASLSRNRNPVIGDDIITFTAVAGSFGPSGVAANSNLQFILEGIAFESVSAPPGITCSYSDGLYYSDPNALYVACPIPSLAPNTALSVNVVGRVKAAFENSDIHGNANFYSAVVDVDLVNNVAEVLTTVRVAEADASVSIVSSNAGPLAGGSYVYSVFVGNFGPDTGVEVVLFYDASSELTIVSAKGPSNCPDCTCIDGACQVPTVNKGKSRRFDFTVTARHDYEGLVRFSASVNSSSDPVLSNDYAYLDLPVTISADIAVTVSSSTNMPVLGETFFLGVLVRNVGPSFTPYMVVEVVPPTSDAVFTPGSDPVSAGGTCTTAAPGQPFTCNTTLVPEGFAKGEAVEFVLPFAIPSYTSGTGVTFSGSVWGPYLDADLNNNAFSVDYVFDWTVDADLSVSSDPFLIVASGSPIAFTQTITNDGPSYAPAGVMQSTFFVPPASLATVASFVAPAGGSCVSSTSWVNCSFPQMLATTSQVVTINVVSVTSYAGETRFSSAVTTGAVYDPVFSNNNADTVITFDNTVDLVINVQLFPDAAIYAGNSFTVPYSVLNGGPSTAFNVIASCELPAGVVPFSLPAQCSVAGSTLTCSLGTLVNYGSASGNLRFRLDGLADDPRVLPFVVTSDSVESDGSDNADSVTVQVEYLVDLDVVIDPSASPIAVGNAQVYAIEVRNKGPSTAVGASVNIVLEAVDEAAGYSWVFSSSGGYSTAGYACVDSYDDSQASGTLSLTCTFSPLAVYQIATVVVTTVIPWGTELQTFNCSAAVSATTPENTLSNNVATNSFLVRDSLTDINIGFASSPSTAVPAGTRIVFSAFVTNLGPDATVNVATVIALPDHSSGFSVSANVGTCTLGASEVSCASPLSLPVGDTIIISISATIDGDYSGPVSLSGSTTSSVFDSDPGDNTATYSIDAVAEANIALTSLALPAGSTVLAGRTYSVVMVVANRGPSPFYGTVATVQLPTGTTFVSGSDALAACVGVPATGSSPAGVTCDLGILAAPIGTSSTVVFGTLTLAADVTAFGTFVIDASVGGTTTQPPGTTSDDSRSLSLVINQRTTDLYITAVAPIPESVIQGQAFTFKYIIGCDGPQAALGVTVRGSPMLTSAVVAASANVSAGSCSYDVESGLFECALGDLAVYDRLSLDLTITSEATFVGPFFWPLNVSSSGVVRDELSSNDMANTSTIINAPSPNQLGVVNDPKAESAAIGVSLMIVLIVLGAVLVALWFLGAFKRWKPPADGEEVVEEEEDDGKAKPFADNGEIANELFGTGLDASAIEMSSLTVISPLAGAGAGGSLPDFSLGAPLPPPTAGPLPPPTAGPLPPPTASPLPPPTASPLPPPTASPLPPPTASPLPPPTASPLPEPPKEGFELGVM